MIKRVLSFAFMLLCIVMANAQMPTALPLNPAVKYGKLPNGLTYYILHNEEPKERANFYIAQKVGSTLEEPQQLGLAHFLEHMAFNGTAHYPGKAMLTYLQNNGLRFGADINAYTAFDETVYNIDNVPTGNQALMDSVLLVLRDWSCDILLEDAEIDAERKVIQEEWRGRNTADYRAFNSMFKSIYKEYQYQQMPIGLMEVVMNFDYQALRDYYHKWYRPDQQGIIIVGDFDVDAMEKKVIEMFSDIPMDPNAAPRTYAPVSDNEEPIYFAFEDPELTSSQVSLYIKYNKIPMEYQNTDAAYVNDLMLNNIASMINQRLSDNAKDPNCKYAGAYVYFGNFIVAKTKGAFTLNVEAKGDAMEALDEALAIVTRACKTGFNQSELDRVNEELKSYVEKLYNERNNTKTSTLAKELINNFTNNESAMGIEQEKEFLEQVLPMLPLSAYNEIASQVITPTNQVICVLQPKMEGKMLPSRETTLANVNEVLNREYEAYVDEVITEPLIAKMPKKGKVKSETTNAVFGTTEFMLSNGVRVIVKTTDFKADEITMNAFRKGGYEAYPESDAANLNMAEAMFESLKFGNFDVVKMSKYLAGKRVSLGYGLGRTTNAFNGSSTKKDLGTLFELVYTAFTNMNPDKTTYDASVSAIIPALENQEMDPMFKFRQRLMSTMYAGNKVMEPLTADAVKSADYSKMFAEYKDAVKNAADYTFVFTGNVDAETIKPLLEQYIASLPSNKKASVLPILNPINYFSGQVEEMFNVEMEVPSTMVYDTYLGYNLEPSIANDVKTDILGDILSNVFTEVIREKEGGAYSPYAYGQYDDFRKAWMITYVIQTNSEQEKRMMEVAHEEFLNLLANGANAEQFNKVKEATLKQYENNIRTNGYWSNAIRLNVLLNLDMVTDHRAAIESLTLEEFNGFMRSLYDGKNRMQVVMHGEPKK